MRRFALLVVVVTLLTGSVARAASYQMTNGTIVDPILHRFGMPHSYSDNNLGPFVNLSDADLTNADLTNAFLTDAFLTDAFLTDAFL